MKVVQSITFFLILSPVFAKESGFFLNKRSRSYLKEMIDLENRKRDDSELTEPAMNLSIFAAFDNLNDRQNNITLVSEIQPKVELCLEHRLSQRLRLSYGSSYTSRRYRDFNSPSYSLSNKELTQISFFTGSTFQIYRSFLIHLRLGVKDIVFFRQNHESVFALEKEKAIFFRVQPKFAIINTRRLNFWANADYEYGKGNEGYLISEKKLGPGLSIEIPFGRRASIATNLSFSKGTIVTNFNSFEIREISFGSTFNIGF